MLAAGLLHYNANKGCSPVVFIQIFDSSDPGTLTVGNALAALNAVDPASISASYFGNVTASSLSNAALDPACLSKCGLSSSGGSLSGLSADLQASSHRPSLESHSHCFALPDVAACSHP